MVTDRRARNYQTTLRKVSLPRLLPVTRAVLSVQSGPDAGRVFSLSRTQPNTIGRAPECTVSIPDGRLSRVHATVAFSEGHWTITDHGSTNGTRVHGVEVDNARLEDGARVLIGGTLHLRFSLLTTDEESSLVSIYQAAVHDGLTRVFNRKALDEHLATEVGLATQGRYPLSVVMFDLDHFKSVNDTHGHAAGDAVLRSIASRVAMGVRADDIVGRYGGEELVVIARGTPLEGATVLAERLRKMIASEPARHGDLEIRLTASFGVASLACCGNKVDAASLLAIADARLYRAKHEGRDRVIAA